MIAYFANLKKLQGRIMTPGKFQIISLCFELKSRLISMQRVNIEI